MEIILYGLFFITGYLVHATYTYVLGLGSSMLLIKRATEDGLLILATAYEKNIYMNETTYQSIIKKGLEEEEIEKYRKMDKLEIKDTMNLVVGTLVRAVPSRYREFISFKDWKTAEKEITRIIKERKMT
tara:strand:- start:1241 stop:1627 length:387 start_codon:yes stop_codon:yes gene_type:complete